MANTVSYAKVCGPDARGFGKRGLRDAGQDALAIRRDPSGMTFVRSLARKGNHDSSMELSAQNDRIDPRRGINFPN